MESQADLALIRKLEEKLFDSSVRGDPDAVAALLADDFLEFGRSGRVYAKAEVIDILAAEASGEPRSVVAYDYRLRPLGTGVFLLTYRTRRQDEAKEVHSLRSSIWQVTGGQWRMVFHQGTPTTYAV